jgi:2-oxo-4-hydroxy-4-carboxy-5-ureidoimidazoline decarboxylase
MISRRRLRMFWLCGALLLAVGMPAPAPAAEVDMAGINAMDRTAFVAQFGGIFENSPWVAEQAFDRKPFASLDALHGAMVDVARTAPAPVQLALLQSHPDLAGKEAQVGAMTASSVAEQASAGLSALQPAEMSEIAELNAAYRKKFGFPFIIAVRMHTKEGIFFEFRRRLHNDTATEFGNNLQNVYVITRLRLNKMLNAG